MPNEQVQFSTVQSFMGGLPARLAASDFSTNVLRPWYPSNAKEQAALARNGGIQNNALLRKDEWKQLDTRVVEVARTRLVGIADLRSRGLTLQLGGLGTLLSEYEKMGDMTAADLDMAGVTGGEKDTLDFTLVGVPVPIVHKDYSINIRRLLASRNQGNALDTLQAQVAARLVADKLESVLFAGAGITVDGNPIYGYTNHPDRNTGTAAGDFGTITNIFPSVNNMVIAAEADNYFGPYVLYVAKTQYAEMRAVYTDGSGQSAWQRCLDAIPQLAEIKPADILAAGSLVLVTMLPDVVDLAIAQDISNVQWDDLGGMVQNFKVMAAMTPRVKSDDANRSGIVHYTGA
jgi:uncharacterized linocin/CFP29 family protein